MEKDMAHQWKLGLRMVLWVDTRKVHDVEALGFNQNSSLPGKAQSASSYGDILPETNMETQKGPYKDYSPSKRGLYGFPR